MTHEEPQILRDINRLYGLKRPSVSHLLGHIFSALISGTTILLGLLTIAIIVALKHNSMSTDNIIALLVSSVVVIAFICGCIAWQRDLRNYQRAFSEARHTYMRDAHPKRSVQQANNSGLFKARDVKKEIVFYG